MRWWAAAAAGRPLRRPTPLALETAPARVVATAEGRRAFLHDVAGALEVAHEPFCDDVPHKCVRVMPALAALKFQREGECGRQVFGIGGRELFVGVGLCPMLEQKANESKNRCYGCSGSAGPIGEPQ
jgi:hypothetical protein